MIKKQQKNTTHSYRAPISTISDLAYIIVFAAFIIALGPISIPVGSAGVPIVIQNMGVILTSLLLGWKRGGLATILFLCLGLLGIPNLAGGRSTLVALAGPTVGYLVGYCISAFVVGAIAQYAHKTTRSRIIFFSCAAITGIIIQYFFGSIGLILKAHLSVSSALAANVPFIPGGILKVVIAVSVALAIHRAVPHLLPQKR